MAELEITDQEIELVPVESFIKQTKHHHWAKMPYWTLHEACVLLVDIDITKWRDMTKFFGYDVLDPPLAMANNFLDLFAPSHPDKDYVLSARTSITIFYVTTSLTLDSFIAVYNQIPLPVFCPGRVLASAL